MVKEVDTHLVDFLPFFSKGDNFYVFLMAFLHIKSPSEKGLR